MSAFSRIQLFLFACFLALAFDVAAWDRGKVERFATLPAGSPNPEGITVDGHGDVYVTGFNPFGTGPGQLFVFNDDGHLNRVVSVADSSPALLGLAFHPTTHELLVIDFGAGVVRSVNPHSGASAIFTAPDGAGGLNALTFDGQGNVYISDSGRGIIWRTGPSGGAATKWVEHALLLPNGVPPFGANGLDFDKYGTALFVANTSNDTVVRIPVTAGSPGMPEVFVQSINGADGLFLDDDDNVWVCANQADEIVVVDKTGRGISKLGDFNGVRKGSPVGLLFPASLARHGKWIYVTNLSLDLRRFNPRFQTPDSQWTTEVSRHTIARVRARILGFGRGDD